MKKILIIGSFDSTPEMIAAAQRIVENAKRDGDTIICGDAPGIDRAVILKCDELGVKVAVYGAFNMVRYCSTGAENSNTALPSAYAVRDRTMAWACDRCFEIWNPKSSGSHRTKCAAESYGKQVTVIRCG